MLPAIDYKSSSSIEGLTRYWLQKKWEQAALASGYKGNAKAYLRVLFSLLEVHLQKKLFGKISRLSKLVQRYLHVKYRTKIIYI